MNINFADIDVSFIKKYLKIEESFEEDDEELELFMSIARQYLCEQCGMTFAEVSQENLLSIPYLILISEMYLERSVNVASNTKVNMVLDRYLNTKRKYI